MNLLEEPWICVKRMDGQQDWVSPLQITEPDIVSLDARRPDFNGSLIQFLIGLIQTTTPMDSHVEWLQWNQKPPEMEVLRSWFKPVWDAFVFDGDGPRFMQDFSLRTEGVKQGEFNEIAGLLIDSPGDNTLKENKDHFIKRNIVRAICMHCAATALWTLQTNAPSGGQGHNTSIRGGGPLTTLLVPSRQKSLWHFLWLNIRERTQFLSSAGDPNKKGMHFIFPWLAEMFSIQPQGGKTSPKQTHPFHIFWGMPRRIRLDFEKLEKGTCDTCQRASGTLISQYLTQARGFDYKDGWIHPLSPYYENKPGEFLPTHPQPGGIGYRHWLGWVLGAQNAKKKTQPASIVTYGLESRRLQGQPYSVWAFGYDMDNMKARCWYESNLQLYGLAEKNHEGRMIIQNEVSCWLVAAEQAVFWLRSAVKLAWFGNGAEARGDLTFIDANFWSGTEAFFYRQLRALIDQARQEEKDPVLIPLREAWRQSLISVCKQLFDSELVGTAPIKQQDPKRIAQAHQQLCRNLYGDPLKSLLGLPVEKSTVVDQKRLKTKTSKRKEVTHE